jgi:hypothetical protein
LVQLHNDNGDFTNLVLIREFRAGSDAQEYPALSLDQLRGRWSGTAATISADWPEPERADCHFEVSGDGEHSLHIDTQTGATSECVEAGRSDPSRQLTWMADGGYHLTPRHVDHRSAFAVEAGWLTAPDRLERLIRRYDASGAWLSYGTPLRRHAACLASSRCVDYSATHTQGFDLAFGCSDAHADVCPPLITISPSTMNCPLITWSAPTCWMLSTKKYCCPI